MKNKVLIELYVVELDRFFDITIPVNEYVGKIIEDIVESVFELTDSTKGRENYYLLNPDEGTVYNNSDLIRDTDIRNAKRIFMV